MENKERIKIDKKKKYNLKHNIEESNSPIPESDNEN